MRTLRWLIAVLLLYCAVGEIRFWKDPGPPVPLRLHDDLRLNDGTRVLQLGPQLAIVDVNGMPWVTIEQNHNNVKIDVPPAGSTRLTFALRNTGPASIVHPLYRFVASPKSVRFRNNYNIYQLYGPDVSSYLNLPYSVSGTTDTQVSIDVTVPAAVANFDLMFESPVETTLHFAATHQQ